MIPPAVQRQVLTGKPGPDLDRLVFEAVQGGIGLEHVAAGRYRLDGSEDAIRALATAAALAGNFFVEIETPKPGTVALDGQLTTSRPYARVTTVSTDRSDIVARAVDRGLKVTTVGVGRFAVTGLSSGQMRWMSEALGQPLTEIHSMWNVTPEAIAEEDRAARAADVSVHVVATLPPRVSETTLVHDADGNLIASRTEERTA